MDSSDAPSPAWNLLDVLEKLPRDVLQQSFWLHLAPLDHAWLGPPDPGLAFRLVWRGTLALADEITHSLRLEQKGNTAPDLALQARHGSFLARQEALQLLLVVDNRWNTHPTPARASAAATDTAGCEGHLVTTLQLGGAACRRLQTLRLTSYSGCTAAAGQAVKACCPVLTDLHLRVEMIEPAFLEPWCSCPHLTKLSLSGCRDEYDDQLFRPPLASALAGLQGLRCLDFDAALTSDHLPLLQQFTSVRDLRLDWVRVYFDEDRAESARDLGEALGRLTQLTALQLPVWTQPYARRAAVPDDRSQLLGAVLAQLSTLQQLRSLAFTMEAEVLQGGYDTLCGLPLLTQLTCSTMSPAVVSTARPPPRLQHPDIGDRALSCVEVAATLRPLLPLTDLRSFNLCVHLCPNAVPDTGGGAEGVAAVAALAAAGRAGQWLGRAPALQLVSIFLYGRCPAPSPAAIPDLFPALLGPLHAQLTSLTMCDASLDVTAVVWPILQLATRLKTLSLQSCEVHAPAVLLLLGQHLPALQRLYVSEVGGLPCPVAVAEVRRHALPLGVVWGAKPSVAQRSGFMAAAHVGMTLAW